MNSFTADEMFCLYRRSFHIRESIRRVALEMGRTREEICEELGFDVKYARDAE